MHLLVVLKDALQKGKIDELNPDRFNGRTFADRVRSLGTTGKTVWKRLEKINELANEISITSAKKLLHKMK